MEKGLILQERDIELLEFLAEYKTITLDNCKYIYGTKTYQEKRICRLVEEKYHCCKQVTLNKGNLILEAIKMVSITDLKCIYNFY